VCNALDALFDDWPAAGDRPSIEGELPVLGLSLNLEQARKSRLEPETAEVLGDPDDAVSPPRKTGRLLARLSWTLIAMVMAFVILAEYTEFQGKSLTQLPMVNTMLTRLGFLESEEAPVFRDLEQIHLVSRELISHPYKAGTLQLTATLVNRAPHPQPFPELEVTLLDSGGDAVSVSLFAPADYLAKGTPLDSRMTPQAYLPLALDLPDPGYRAVGFELNFR
jgi:hypothetical protein